MTVLSSNQILLHLFSFLSNSSLSYLSISGASLIRSLVEVQHCWFSTFQENEKQCSFRRSKLNVQWVNKKSSILILTSSCQKTRQLNFMLTAILWPYHLTSSASVRSDQVRLAKVKSFLTIFPRHPNSWGSVSPSSCSLTIHSIRRSLRPSFRNRAFRFGLSQRSRLVAGLMRGEKDFSGKKRQRHVSTFFQERGKFDIPF